MYYINDLKIGINNSNLVKEVLDLFNDPINHWDISNRQGDLISKLTQIDFWFIIF